MTYMAVERKKKEKGHSDHWYVLRLWKVCVTQLHMQLTYCPLNSKQFKFLDSYSNQDVS